MVQKDVTSSDKRMGKKVTATTFWKPEVDVKEARDLSDS